MGQHNRTFWDYIYLYLKGLVMGTANKVPGVSGGMFALVLDFYEELIYSFQKINGKAWKLLINGRFSQLWQYVNIKFLLLVNLGSISAYFTISLLIDYFMRPISEAGLGYNFEVFALFFGMIIGSIYYVYLRIPKWTTQTYLGALMGLLFGLWISFLDPLTPNENFIFVFFCGIISVSGMALPGFSGSFVLIILGNYNLLLVEAVNNLFGTVVALLSGDWSNLGTTTADAYERRVLLLQIVGLFGLGSLGGLIIFSRIMGYLLKHYHHLVLSILMGFIGGSLGAAWPWKLERLNEEGRVIAYERFLPAMDFQFIIQFILVMIGIAIVALIDFYERRKNA